MQAVIQTGGKQFTVAEGDKLLVELLDADVGGEVKFDDVRLVIGEKESRIGTPRVDGVTVTGKVLGLSKGPKLRSLKFRRRKDSQTVIGHRQQYHKIEITGIEGI